MQDVAATLTLLTNLPKIVSSLCRFKLRRFSWKRLGCPEQASRFQNSSLASKVTTAEEPSSSRRRHWSVPGSIGNHWKSVSCSDIGWN